MSTEDKPPGEASDDDGRLRRFARRLLDRKELADDTRELLAGVLATSDKAKSEFVRMMGREVGHYLDGLNLKNDLLDIATNYKLEVHATFHLSPVASGSDEPARSTSESDEEPTSSDPPKEP
jgi:hypothetical protein